jgi:hypothetical protein
VILVDYFCCICDFYQITDLTHVPIIIGINSEIIALSQHRPYADYLTPCDLPTPERNETVHCLAVNLLRRLRLQRLGSHSQTKARQDAQRLMKRNLELQ